MNKPLRWACLCPLLVFGCSQQHQPFPDPHTPHFTDPTLIKTGPQHCREPSGIVFSTRRGTLFVVDDEGEICELQPDGALVRKSRITESADLEGITIDPATGLLYAVNEYSSTILELHPDSLEVLRQFPVETASGVRLPAGSDSNQGIEAITFAPNPDNPSGGTFFIADQGWHTRHSKSLAAVYEVDAPLHEAAVTGLTARIVRHFEPGITDLSGLYYDHSLRQLLLISDTQNTLMLLTADGETRASYPLPEGNQEGITLDTEGYVYIAEDSGDITRYTFDATIAPLYRNPQFNEHTR